MKSNVTEHMFIDGFRECNREDNFSYEDFDDITYSGDYDIMRFPIYKVLKCVGEHIIVRDE